MIANNAIRHAVELRLWAGIAHGTKIGRYECRRGKVFRQDAAGAQFLQYSVIIIDGFTTPQTRKSKAQAAGNGMPFSRTATLAC